MDKAMDMLTRQHASASVRELESIDFEKEFSEIHIAVSEDAQKGKFGGGEGFVELQFEL